MKNNGLRNRFNERDRMTWIGWHSCLVCDKNCFDALHHIISPSSSFYVEGEHNTSILNSCPIHNYPCHIGREGLLFQEEAMRVLLAKTAEALDWQGYEYTENDREFICVYKKLYGKRE